MREGKYPGSFYCPKPGDGPKGYCTQRVKVNGRGEAGNIGQTVQNVVQSVRHANHAFSLAQAEQASQNRQEGPQNAPGIDNSWALVLDVTARIYQGTGKGQEAVEVAAALRALLP
jgi:hypothetical protein